MRPIVAAIIALAVVPAAALAQTSATLEAGFGSWSALGSLDATRSIGEVTSEPGSCQGFVAAEPAAVLEIADDVADLRARAATTRPDMLMIVRGPNGFVQCAQQQGLTPGVALSNPPAGAYEIFLGLAAQNESATYTLYVEEGPAVVSQPEGSGVESEIPAAVIEDVVFGRIGDLQSCRERLHASDPTFSGRVLVQWTVTPEGTVSDATVLAAEPPNEYLANCVLEVVRTLRFDPPSQLTVVTFPFDFFPL